ncbi:unnamed protein product, partial [Strongylus vulgaris]
TNPNPRAQFFEGSETNSVREVTTDQGTASEVFFGDVDHADQVAGGTADESSTVMLGDVLFAEDGSLFLLEDIVSTGLHPYTEAVEEVYDGEIIDEGAESQTMAHYENRIEEVADQSYPGVSQREFHRREEVVGDGYDRSVVHSYNNAENVREGYSDGRERQDVQQRYGGDVVIDEATMHYDESEVVLGDDYEHQIEEYNDNQHYQESPTAEGHGNVIVEEGSNMISAAGEDSSSL